MSGFHEGIPLHFRDQVVCGDARVLAAELPDESVDLVFTDPVYENLEDYRWLAETARRVLKPNSAALIFCGIEWIPESIAALRSGGLSYRWMFVCGKPQGFRSGRFFQKGFSNWQCLLWMEKGKSSPVATISDLAFCKDGGRNNFHASWAKNPVPYRHWLGRFVPAEAVVADFFTGGGTVPAVCRELERRFVAFEIEPDQAARARTRVDWTEPPLLVPMVEDRLFDLFTLDEHPDEPAQQTTFAEALLP